MGNMLKLLLSHGADPTMKNSYGKSAIDFAQPELDAAKNVMKAHDECLAVLTQWEMENGIKSVTGQVVCEAEADPKEGSATMLAVELQNEGGAGNDSSAGKPKPKKGAKKGGGGKKGTGKKGGRKKAAKK